ncbi:acyltransferase family-domain-containing protein [Podospora australis]|uniref:Acyltransferase family-domain-containing protein n=1 Tax=Podospora australis TaxID=1536484 RepID=A0AAN7ACJ0_9PEZI|nr:acyltransferase family-domain-containing protein [Podospora australis]
MPSDVVDMEAKREMQQGKPDLFADAISTISSVRFYNLWRLLNPWPRSNSRHPEKLRPTVYLDGLRGFAAFLVYWHHHQLWAHNPLQKIFMESAYCYEGYCWFMALPFVRIFFHGGHFAVAVFFVISGYVLSAKPISLIQAGDQAKLADNVGSALFRRWLRLYIPVIATTFIFMTITYCFNIWVFGLWKRPTYLAEVWWWYCEMKNFTFLFDMKTDILSYNYHLWSIPIEMKGSIVVYTALLAFARCPRNARLWLEGLLIFYFLYIVDGWWGALFVAGMLMNDLHQLAAKKELPDFFERLRPYKMIIYYHFLFIGLFLGGVPAHSPDVMDLRKNPGWYYLSFLKSQSIYHSKWYFLFFAAVMLVSAVPHIGWLKRFFEARFCQYLGRISYAFYLVHGPVLSTIGDRLYTAVGWANDAQVRYLPQWVNIWELPRSGPMGMEFSFLVPHLVMLPLTLYLAEIATRVFDEPSVRFPQWLYRSTTVSRPAKLPA